MRALKILMLAMALLTVEAGIATAQTPAAAPSGPAPEAASSPMATPSAQMPTSVDAAYSVGLGDVLEVSVVGQTGYNTRVRVSPDGNVLLPLIGNVAAVNLRPGDLATQIGAALDKGGFYSKPVVRVEVVLVASRFVTILGQVGSPGLIPLDRSYRVSEILARVGAKFGSGNETVIITHANGSQEKLNMSEIATGGGAKDPVISVGDKIYVPPSEAEVFYVSGSVHSPGAFPITPGITVRTALARAGGVAENGNEKKKNRYLPEGRKGAARQSRNDNRGR